MKTKYLSLLCIVLPLLAACQADDAPPTRADNSPAGKPVCFGELTVTEVTTDATTRAVTRTTSTPFGEEGTTITIGMSVPIAGVGNTTTFADYTCNASGKWVAKDKPLYWGNETTDHTFEAYYPALTAEEKAAGARTNLSLPITWIKESYDTYRSYLKSGITTPQPGSTVALELAPLLTSIEVRTIQNAPTYSNVVMMQAKTQGVIGSNGKAEPAADATLQEVQLWKTTDANTGACLFRGMVLPQSYPLGALILLHGNPREADAKLYKASSQLTLAPATTVTFEVAPLPGHTLNNTAGGLENALKSYTGNQGGALPSRLKITGTVNEADINSLPQATGVVCVDMGEATMEGEATETPFKGYSGSIKTLILPKEMKAIPAKAFSSSRLESIVLPEGITTIGEYCFKDCLIRRMELPASIESIGELAWAANPLFTLIIHCSLNKLPARAFDANYNISTIVCMDEALQSTKLEQHVFWGCTALTNLDFLPETMTSIEFGAFRDCQGLVNVTLPPLIKRLWEPFNGCKALQKMALDGSIPIETSSENGIGSKLGSNLELFLYNATLTQDDVRIAPFIGDSWGKISWANIHWGYKGFGSKYDANNYNYHKNSITP